jgi:hypothetical protein
MYAYIHTCIHRNMHIILLNGVSTSLKYVQHTFILTYTYIQIGETFASKIAKETPGHGL